MIPLDEEKVLRDLESKIKEYPDFPIKGILFRDIMPIMADPRRRELMTDIFCKRLKSFDFDTVLGIESRGFLFGPLLASKLSLPFVPIRKKNKLPGALYSIDYDLEYGKDTLQVQVDSLPKQSKCIIVDDLIATGGSLEAAKKLVELTGSKVVASVLIIELVGLEGRKKLGNTPIITLYSY